MIQALKPKYYVNVIKKNEEPNKNVDKSQHYGLVN